MSAPSDPPIRDAATVIVLRQDREEPEVLMGQRGSKAVFMPSKYVFPGGGVDKADAALSRYIPLDPSQISRLQARSPSSDVDPLALAAVRELWEETGLKLGRADVAASQESVPEEWADFYAAGMVPDLSGLRFVFRAVTPTGRPRRFDARFFLIDATSLSGDLDDFSQASDELGHLHWIGLEAARSLNLPFITDVVMAELTAILANGPAHPVPFFNHDAERTYFHML